MDATRAPNFDQARFSPDVIERGTTTIVEFAGELDIAARSRALHVLANAIDRDKECVVLDLARLTFMDSAGIHLAVGASAQTERRGVRFVIIPGPRQIRAVFELCGLHDVLPFVGWSQTTNVRGVAGPAGGSAAGSGRQVTAPARAAAPRLSATAPTLRQPRDEQRLTTLLTNMRP